MWKKPIARFSLLFVSSLFLLVGSFGIPTAAEASVTCQEPSIGNFTPYVYNGSLHSFEYTIDSPSGISHLPLGIEVAGVDVDLYYVSVWHNQGPNRVLIHVDIPESIAMSGNTEINVTNLQITQGPPPICVSGAVFHVNLSGTYVPPTAPPTTPTVPVVTAPETPETPVEIDPVIETPEVTDPEDTATTTEEGEQCSTMSNGWLIFLALLDIIISAIILLSMAAIARSNLRLSLAVLVPPLVFVGIWYIFNSCHSAVWFPILSVVLAIIVLTASGTPDAFEGIRVKIMRFFGKRTKTIQLKLSEATSIMEVRK